MTCTKRHTPELILLKPRQAQAEMAQGLTLAQVCQKLGVSAPTLHRWPPGMPSSPRLSRQAVEELIASRTTRTGLLVRAELDTRQYETGIKVSDAKMAELRITPE